MRLLTYERYKTYQTEFSYGHPKFIQSWCVSYLNEWHMQQHNFLVPAPWGLGEGPKVKYHKLSITKSFSNIFTPNFVCLLTNERYKTLDGISIRSPGSCPRVWDLGVLGGQKFNFLNIVMWHIILKGMNSSTESTEKNTLQSNW